MHGGRLLRRLAVAGAIACLVRPAQAVEVLDGTEWKVRRSGLAHFFLFWKRDTFVFEDGRFTSTDALLHGYTPAAYFVSGAGTGLGWSSVQVHRDGDRLEWRGERYNGWMEGTLRWARPDGRVRTWRWRAKLKL